MSTSTSDSPAGPSSPGRRPRRRSTLASLNGLSPVPTYLGLGIVVIGFVLIGITWVKVADQVNVADQLPYFASGGFGGLGLIMAGLTAVSVAAKRRDSLLRAAQMELLASALLELRAARNAED